jgi:hypothetical protein
MLPSLETILLETLDGGSNSLVAIAVGTAEGTRTPIGSYTGAWWGHTDPGNGAQNQGSFSYQGIAGSPREADLLQIAKLKAVLLPKFLKAFHDLALPPERFKELWVLACDCFVQSELACIGDKGFLDLVSFVGDGDADEFINCRVNAYYDPKTDKLDAPGFGNNPQRLHNDQKRRTEAVLRALAVQGEKRPSEAV